MDLHLLAGLGMNVLQETDSMFHSPAPLGPAVAGLLGLEPNNTHLTESPTNSSKYSPVDKIWCLIPGILAFWGQRPEDHSKSKASYVGCSILDSARLFTNKVTNQPPDPEMIHCTFRSANSNL